MKRLDCNAESVKLQIPPCGGGAVTAKLTRRGHAEVALTVGTLQDEQIDITIPPATTPYPARGIWTVEVQTPCGCFTTYVYVECPSPALAGVHTPTPTGIPAIACCAPPGSIVIEVFSLGPPDIDVEGYPLAQLLVDDGAAYAIRLGASVAGLYRWLDEDGNLLASGAYAAQGTTAYHPLDLTCGTYYLAPPGA